jgi:hypothetical protein
VADRRAVVVRDTMAVAMAVAGEGRAVAVAFHRASLVENLVAYHRASLVAASLAENLDIVAVDNRTYY